MGSSHDGALYGEGLLGDIGPRSRGPLKDKFLMPPFSTWNTREGFWQDRKRRWLAIGIQSELGRDGELTYNIPVYLRDGSTGRKIENQTSIFDPVVCELCYTWWCPPEGVVIDPFAGGSVRGIVASILDRKYWGCDLSQAQINANNAQITDVNTGKWKPKWRCGDSYKELGNGKSNTVPKADFVFSCPPYGSLEKYSDDPKDISNMPYEKFLEAYKAIIYRACNRLRNNRYAAWVVGNYRDKNGNMIDLVGDTIRAFQNAGLAYYNDIILINSVGSGAMRSNTSFIRGHRKMVKLHQNVLVFVKGSNKQASEAVGSLSG